MPEGVHGYPRWEGELSDAPRAGLIIDRDIRRLLRSQWGQAALILVFGYAILFMGAFSTSGQTRGSSVHTWDAFVDFMNIMRWGGLALAVVMGAPLIAQDTQRNALELYLSRSVTSWGYLFGKAGGVFLVTAAAMWIPGLLYYGGSFLFFEDQPESWAWRAPLALLAYGALWSFLVTGLALALSTVSRSPRGATLTLVGVIFGLDILVGGLLSGITQLEALTVASPLAAFQQGFHMLFAIDAPFDWPAWWGIAAWGALSAVAWGTLLMKRPTAGGDGA